MRLKDLKYITINKEIECVCGLMDEMMDDVITHKPSHISFNVDGVIMEFDNITITLKDEFLKISDDGCAYGIKYSNICGYSISSFYVDRIKGWTINNIDDLWDEYSQKPSTLPSAFLSQTIPHDIKKDIVCGFLCEYDGYNDYDDIKADDWEFERYERFMDNNNTYKELNDSLSDYLWSFQYPSHLIKDEIKDGVWDDMNDLLWINDIIINYLPRNTIGELKEMGWSDDDE